jgi:hypothetical protein
METIKQFIDEYKKDYSELLKYFAGEICENGEITNQQKGAEETFSVGMPVYDIDGKELGRLSIGLFSNLNYHTEGIIIPVETWKVDNYKGKRQKIKTFYQQNSSPLPSPTKDN